MLKARISKNDRNLCGWKKETGLTASVQGGKWQDKTRKQWKERRCNHKNAAATDDYGIQTQKGNDRFEGAEV